MPTFDQLKGLAFNQHADEVDAISAETLVAEKKLEIIRLKDELGRAISLTTRNAYEVGKIDGKNAEQRQLQLDAVLDADQSVQEARAKLAQAEKDLVQAETVAAYERAQARYSRSLFEAALACTKVATSPTIMYIGKPPNGDGYNRSTDAFKMNPEERDAIMCAVEHDAAEAEARAAEEAWSQYLSDEAMARAEDQGWQPGPEDDDEIPF